jgi:ABC-type transporter Mla maintaining outer membrane lipid asymmetry ATPase subunit MlaF
VNGTYTSAIRTRGLTKDYGDGHGVFDLDLDLDLDIERGEIFGFLGPNGAGKSTTMRLLLDLVYPKLSGAAVLNYSGHDPLVSGPDVADLAVLCAASVALVAFAALAFQRRDLRA